MPTKHKDFAASPGQTFGRLTVLDNLPESTETNPRYRCRCVCGVELTVYGHQLARGKPNGCYKCRKARPKVANRGDMARAGWGGKLPPTPTKPMGKLRR
mgnify:CR=1 FL=1